MSSARRQYIWTGLLGALSLASIVFTGRHIELETNLQVEREPSSQDHIDQLKTDVGSVLSTITNWQSFCEDPQTYLASARTHGSYQITTLTSAGDTHRSRPQTEALYRCRAAVSQRTPAQFRLCMNAQGTPGQLSELARQDFVELNFEFRNSRSQLLKSCEAIRTTPDSEVQVYFTAYGQKNQGGADSSRLTTAALRIPVQSQSH